MTLSCHDRSGQVQSLTKTKQDNNVTVCIGAVHAENDMEMSKPIGSGTDYDENQIGQLHQ